MKRAITRIALTVAALWSFCGAYAASVSFSGSSRSVIEIEPERNTGLDRIFVLWSTDGVTATFSDPAGSGAKWYRYSNLGGGYAEEITGIEHSGTESSLSALEGDMGYIIEYGDRRYYFWVTQYKSHEFHAAGISAAAEQDCDATLLNISSPSGPIHYYTINGQQRTLDQQIEILYDNLQFSDAHKMWEQVAETHTIEYAAETIRLMPPVYCQTDLTLRGDRFLKEWGMEVELHSDTFRPVAVDVRTEAVQNDFSSGDEEQDASNQIHGEDADLGGSAPADITFYAYVTDGVIHNEWQMTTDPNFEEIEYRFNEQDLNYIFTEEGVYYLRFVGSNEDGSCEAYGDTYTVAIGSSELRCPNAFSPGTSEGVNDVWKVAYRSILDFECWIFDRYGKQLFHYTDITDGWDGKYKGKLVKPGVYYYVIQATGADGKKFKKSGDINIVRFRENESTGPEE